MINRSKLYDLIYDKADKLIKKYNPCGIYKDANGFVMCNFDYGNGHTCCCDCRYIGLYGCVIENAACRVFLCMHERRKYPVLGKKLRKLERILDKYNMERMMAYKEEVFNKELVNAE